MSIDLFWFFEEMCAGMGTSWNQCLQASLRGQERVIFNTNFLFVRNCYKFRNRKCYFYSGCAYRFMEIDSFPNIFHQHQKDSEATCAYAVVSILWRRVFVTWEYCLLSASCQPECALNSNLGGFGLNFQVHLKILFGCNAPGSNRFNGFEKHDFCWKSWWFPMRRNAIIVGVSILPSYFSILPSFVTIILLYIISIAISKLLGIALTQQLKSFWLTWMQESAARSLRLLLDFLPVHAYCMTRK